MRLLFRDYQMQFPSSSFCHRNKISVCMSRAYRTLEFPYSIEKKEKNRHQQITQKAYILFIMVFGFEAIIVFLMAVEKASLFMFPSVPSFLCHCLSNCFHTQNSGREKAFSHDSAEKSSFERHDTRGGKAFNSSN